MQSSVFYTAQKMKFLDRRQRGPTRTGVVGNNWLVG